MATGVGNIIWATNTSGCIIGSTLLTACGLGMFYGLVRRPFSRPAGNALILLTTISALLVFWLVVPTVLALIVWIGVITGGFGDRAVAAVTPEGNRTDPRLTHATVTSLYVRGDGSDPWSWQLWHSGRTSDALARLTTAAWRRPSAAV